MCISSGVLSILLKYALLLVKRTVHAKLNSFVLRQMKDLKESHEGHRGHVFKDIRLLICFHLEVRSISFLLFFVVIET